FKQYGTRIGAGERDAQIRERVAVALERPRDAGDRIFDRLADTNFVIARAQARRILGAHRGDDFAGPQRQIEFSVALCLRNRYVLAREADIELIEGNAAFSRRREDVDLGAEREQSRRQIAAEGREADAAAFWRDVTNCAG